MSDFPRVTREELEKLDKAALINLVLLFQAQLEKLSQRVHHLEDQVAKNSSNSSKPSGSEGLTKPKTQSLRRSEGRKPGGQEGHEGHTLCRVDKPDHRQVHGLNSCPHCENDLSHVAVSGWESRQVFDIPPVQIEVTEHQAEIKECPACGKEARATFPAGVTQPVQYGPRLQVQASYLNNYHFIPIARTCELLNDFYGQAPAYAFVGEANQSVETSIEPALTKIREQLTQADVVHFDETGMRVAGQTQWVHAAATDSLTYYDIHQKRGQTAMTAMGILPNFRGRALHDHWKPYQNFTECAHAFCNAHHLRELQFVTDQYEQAWATELAQLLLDGKAEVANADPEGTSLSPDRLDYYDQRYRAILQQGFAANPPPELPRSKPRGRPKQSPPKNLLDRLDKHQSSILTYLSDFRVPFDNNLVERDVRMVKVKQKVSGAFRTPSGASSFCAIRSYISTVRKQGGNVIFALQSALDGQPFIPPAPPFPA
ncbi:MAG: IS66 family transposase [Caldilineaceae bacterium]|nr:IS66 family transposase [Caldilineaceae bacterium]MBX3053851.1 IS66 family transposase [Caldilineaceae bacterium]